MKEAVFDFNRSLSSVDKGMLSAVADIHGNVTGAFNLRRNGEAIARSSSENIRIEKKKDKPGIDVYIKPFTKDESVHIPVILTVSGKIDRAYNDFYVGEGACVKIIAGCGIHNCGGGDSEHDGTHCFHIGKNAVVSYCEKHYGEGDGSGKKILNPVAVIEMDEGSSLDMESVQIRGVDSTHRETSAKLAAGARLKISEKLMTHGKQSARSDVTVELNGEGSSARIISRTVGRDSSVQLFYPKAVGNNNCRAHVQCDSIIMDNARISSIPAISANHPEAQIIHEAAIGKINNDQLLKLQSFGLTEEEAEAVIIEGFLK